MQYALFQLKPSFMRGNTKTNYAYWLRNVVSSSQFSFMNSNGALEIGNASSIKSIRPRILVG